MGALDAAWCYLCVREAHDCCGMPTVTMGPNIPAVCTTSEYPACNYSRTASKVSSTQQSASSRRWFHIPDLTFLFRTASGKTPAEAALDCLHRSPHRFQNASLATFAALAFPDALCAPSLRMQLRATHTSGRCRERTARFHRSASARRSCAAEVPHEDVVRRPLARQLTNCMRWIDLFSSAPPR
jgi:hypothetical protein